MFFIAWHLGGLFGMKSITRSHGENHADRINYISLYLGYWLFVEASIDRLNEKNGMQMTRESNRFRFRTLICLKVNWVCKKKAKIWNQRIFHHVKILT